MINPENITNYYRTQDQLEEFLLFCVVVAGKRARVQAQKLDKFLMHCAVPPFSWIRSMDNAGTLEADLKWAGLGQYKRLATCFRALAHGGLNLRTCDWIFLATIHGIGFKTAKLFILHSRPGQRMAVLDTHILAQLRTLFPLARIPRQSPNDSRKYAELEAMWLGHLYQTGEDDPAAADLKTWIERSRAA